MAYFTTSHRPSDASQSGSLSEAALARVAVGVCRRAQEYAGVGAAEIDILNTTRGGVLQAESN